jgi:hypothetical protein
MRRNTFVLLLLVFNTSFLFCRSISLKSYDELFGALKEGKSVRVVIHFGKCQLIIDGKEEKAPDAIGGMDLKTFECFAGASVKNKKSFITSSETQLISHPRFGYVYNYVKLRIYEDDTVEIIARYLDPKNLDVKMDETFRTSINSKHKDGAVLFFAN